MPISGQFRFERPDHPASPSEALIREGRYAEALATIDAVLTAHPDSTRAMRVKHQALMGLRRFDEAAQVIARALEQKPDNPYYRKLHAIAVKDSGAFADALPLLEVLHRDSPEDLEVLSALCVTHFRLGNEAEALRFGQMKLDLLVAAAPDEANTAGQQEAVGRNVVSYSLWGAAAQYCDGALHNARKVPETLPGWIARFYVDDSVPDPVIDELRDATAEVVFANDEAPLMRRFLVHDDPEVGRYLVRDSDSRIGPREMAAIDDWLESGLGFHAIRDHPFHTELMQGGLWGGIARRGFSMGERLHAFRERFGLDHGYGADQYFLGAYVWPTIRHDLLIHDSYYRTPGSRPFPDGSRGTDNDHVGMGIVLTDRARA